MNQCNYSLVINWPQKALFNFVCDVDNAAYWQSGVIDAAWVGLERHSAGALFNELCMVNEKLLVLCKEVTACLPCQRRSVSWQEGGREMIHTLEFAGMGESTRVTSLLMVGPDNDDRESNEELEESVHKRIVEDLEKLKQLLEEDAVVGPGEDVYLERISERNYYQ